MPKQKQEVDQTEQKLEEARNAFQELKVSINLQRIVCVDDFFGVDTAEDFASFYGLYLEANPRPSLPEIGEIEDADDMELLRESWDVLDATTQRNILVRLRSTRQPEPPGSDTSPPTITGTDQTVFERLETLCKDLLQYVPLSLTTWREKQEDLLAESATIKTLFLFDENLEGQGGRENEGVYLMLDAQKASNAYCGLFSKRFRPEDEPERWEAFRKDQPDIDVYRCVPISKTTLVKRPLEFVRRIKFTALTLPCHQLCEQIADEIKSSQNEAVEEVRRISPYDFDHIVLRKSCDEGMWEVDSLLRLLAIFERDKVRSRVKNNLEIEKLLQTVRQLSQVPAGSLSETAKLKTWQLQQRELYDDADYINAYHLPVECGDIFEDTDTGISYILLSQPCDLMVRETPKGGRAGERRFGVVDATLIEIRDQRPSTFGELIYFKEDKTWYADFTNAVSIRLDIIDMCVYQPDGNAKLVSGVSPPNRLLPVWQKRYAIHQNAQQSILEKHQRFQNIPDTDARIDALNMLLQPASNRQDCFKANIDPVQLTISYNIRRTRRLNSTRANALLAQFAYYIARPAFDTDW